MRRTAGILLVLALVVPLASLTPASAHFDFHILGYQFVWNDSFEIGTTGWVGTPAGPIKVGPVPVNDGLASVTNRDQEMHTFTECTSACETANPIAVNPRFDVELLPGANVDLPELFGAGRIVFFCRVHTWMRGEVNLVG